MNTVSTRTGLRLVSPAPLEGSLALGRMLPKAPVLDWAGLWPRSAPQVPDVFDLPHRAYLTSGRAALFAALQQLQLPVGAGVLVPTYHCPTMVAPVLKSGLVPHYFPIGADGLPLLDAITAASAAAAKVMFVAHYFGLPKSLAAVRAWCTERDIVLVEDCAHAYFGQAGERPVGQWGDYATASLSKFFPVAEAGLLASARRPLLPLNLQACGAVAQTKGLVDVVEFAHRHHRLAGLSHVLAPFFWLKNRRHQDVPPADPLAAPPPDRSPEAMMDGCDMGRIHMAPTHAARILHRLLAIDPIVQARRTNYTALANGLLGAAGARLLSPQLPTAAAPYVCPLWVDDPARADLVYAQLRQAGLPVFRWDQIWPGTPVAEHDTGPRWSRQVIQLLCHQSLGAADTARMVQTTRHLLQST